MPSDSSREQYSFDPSIEQRVQELLFTRELAARIGRFHVLEHIGRGGMGRVYAAYDEELDRKVAIKLLLDDDLPSEDARSRFRREAQALARLSHPHVVTVYEVGETGGQLFLAMEFIRGQSLDAWLDSQPEWSDVLDAFIQAGRGLAAAHEAGLVHRDLKPNNIMRGEDGVVKVLDFGLARVADDTLDKHTDVQDVDISQSGRTSLTSQSLTIPGTIMGTPAYMSPEQLRGDEVDARSDQFGFCVALFEAIHGTRPWPRRKSFAERLAAIERGVDPPATTRTTKVPAAIREAVHRGLEAEPNDRWPSMNALLEVLSREPRRPSRWWMLAGIALVGAGAGAMSRADEARLEPCAGAAEQMIGIWDDARRAEVEAAIRSVDVPYAGKAWERARVELDAYADRWVSMHTETCEATTVRGEQSTQMLDLRMACLRRASIELGTVVDTLATADVGAVRNAHELTAGLWPLARCADTEALLADIEPPSASEADAVEAARLELARVKNLGWAGRYDDAQAALDAARTLVDGLEYGPLQTELALREGRYYEQRSDGEAAERALKEALQLATRWKQWDLLAESAHRLLFVVGQLQGRPEEGLHYWPLAYEGEHDPLRKAATRQNFAMILNAQGKRDEAEAEFRAGLSDALETTDPDHVKLILFRNNLANFLTIRGKSDEAEALAREAITVGVESLGAEHLTVVTSRGILAGALRQQGRRDEAEAQARAAIDAAKQTLDPQSPRLGELRSILAQTLEEQGKHEEAEAEYRAVLSSMLESFGPDHRRTAQWRTGLANLLYVMEKLEAAEQEFTAALSVLEGLLEHDHPTLARIRLNLAYVLESAGKLEDALALAELAWERNQKPDIFAGLQGDNTFLLARLLWDVEGSMRDRARARSLARDTLVSFRVYEKSFPEAIPEVRQWLESHPLE